MGKSTPWNQWGATHRLSAECYRSPLICCQYMERKLLIWRTQNSADHTTSISKFDIISRRISIFEFLPQQGDFLKCKQEWKREGGIVPQTKAWRCSPVLASNWLRIRRIKHLKCGRRPVLNSHVSRHKHGSFAPERARSASQLASPCEASFELQHLACYLTLSSRRACYGRLKALCDTQANISL